MPEFSLYGRNALVTGGSRGIGAAIVQSFVSNFANVAFCHHNDHEGALRLIHDLGNEGFEVNGVDCDVADETSVAQLAEWTHKRLGQLDILVNCAGIGGAVPFPELDVTEWDRMIAVHLRGTFLVTRVFFEGMKHRSYGRIINISSQLAYKGAPMLAHYCAAKAGILGFTRALAREAAPFGVLVNAVAPGPVETDMLLSLPIEWQEEKRKQLPIGRFAKVDEITSTVLLLASSAGSYYVGQTLSPNGGDVML